MVETTIAQKELRATYTRITRRVSAREIIKRLSECYCILYPRFYSEDVKCQFCTDERQKEELAK